MKKREIPVVLNTAYGTIPDAVEAMKKGAADFITKPFNTDIILHTVRKIFHMTGLEISNKLLVLHQMMLNTHILGLIVLRFLKHYLKVNFLYIRRVLSLRQQRIIKER